MMSKVLTLVSKMGACIVDLTAGQKLTVIESSGCCHIPLCAADSPIFHSGCLLILRKS